MDREYLEDYEQKEREQHEKLLRKIQEDRFDFEEGKYPPDERFVKLQRPIATAIGRACMHAWAQIPFSGSLILCLEAFSESDFEKMYFPISDIPEIIDFIKSTGRLQVALTLYPTQFVGIDYLDPFFTELRPPVLYGTPDTIYGNEKEIRFADETFKTLAHVNFSDFLRKWVQEGDSRHFNTLYTSGLITYRILKLCRYSIVENIESFLVDDPSKALDLLMMCQALIVGPLTDLRTDLANYSFQTIKSARILPLIHQPKEIRFPCEIGRFLLRKLTYAAQDMRACYELMDHYEAYDLRKVQESLNKAIVTNTPDIINKGAEELSEILDNVWLDPSIPRRINHLKRGIPMSVAAIGTAVSALTGGVGGFLAGLGFNVGAAFLKAEIGGLSEKVGTFFAKRSYQANVYDFKKKYEKQIRK